MIRRWATLVLWPFPTLRTLTAFYAGLAVGVVAATLVFALGFAVVSCGVRP